MSQLTPLQVIGLMSLLLPSLLRAQQIESITLDSCYELARRHYPLTEQSRLIDASAGYSLSTTSRAVLPQLAVQGQATYQSEVTSLPIALPGEVEPLSKDQYKLYGEVVQPLTELFTNSRQREMVRARREVEQRRLDVELYKLRERISGLFFSILLTDAQLAQNDILQGELGSGLDQMNASIAGGTALKTSAQQIEAELMKVRQRNVDLRASRRANVEALALLTNQPIDESTVFAKPAPPVLREAIGRPELAWYASQQEVHVIQDEMVGDRNLPRLSLFFQGGVGRPALNFLDNEPRAYYLTGIRLGWNVSGLYTSRQERQLQRLEQRGVDLQRQTFLLQNSTEIRQHGAELDRLRQLLASDDGIIALREQIAATARVQLENGTITAHDYLTRVNAADEARQSRALHEIQYLYALHRYNITTGN